MGLAAQIDDDSTGRLSFAGSSPAPPTKTKPMDRGIKEEVWKVGGAMSPFGTQEIEYWVKREGEQAVSYISFDAARVKLAKILAKKRAERREYLLSMLWFSVTILLLVVSIIAVVNQI